MRTGRNVVLDTNVLTSFGGRLESLATVLISATFWNGKSRSVFRLLERDGSSLYLSPFILAEYDDVLSREEILEKRERGQLKTAKIVEKLIDSAVIIEPETVARVIGEDPDDDHVLACALAARAKFLVTQDNHLLKIKRYKGVHVVTPEEFLDTRE